ncbi:MAG: hypothetical protein IJ390_02480 [Lachnospiraceae bacterium]|nr:hypothetical protein [Lachnospiraceae bacterium]
MEGLKELRLLARAYYEQAMSPINTERMKLHRAVNDLKMERPVVLINEIPFHELNFDGSLTCVCTDPLLRSIEDFLRKKLFQWKYFPGDMILPPYISVTKVIHCTGIGVEARDEELYIGSQEGICAHRYYDQLATPEDVEKIHLPVITYDKEETMARYTKAAEALGDIIPVKITGHGCYSAPWDNIARLRGVDNLLIDLIEEPEHSHNIVSKIYACEESRLKQMEDLDLFEIDQYDLHCTTALCSDLAKDYDGGKVLRRHIWGRGMAQIFASVGKGMHEEFDIDYMKKLMEPFGLTYYGCCEPLDKKIDIVEKISNLRKISITPWADVDVAAEAIGKKYVLANKPNPAAVTVPLDEDALRKEIGRTLAAVKRNGCSCDIVLKDISSAGHDVKNLIRWEQIVMEMVKNF